MVNPYSKISLLFYFASMFFPFFTGGPITFTFIISPIVFFTALFFSLPVFFSNFLFVISFFGKTKWRKWTAILTLFFATINIPLLAIMDVRNETYLGPGYILWMAAFVVNVIRHEKSNSQKKVAL